MARVILDTGVLVAAVCGRLDLAAIAEEDDVALPAVALAEYLTGVELDTDPARRAAQQAFLEELLAVTPVADHTPQVAVHHAALLAHVRRTGRPRGAHDLIIAATARATDRVLVSTDAQAGFADLPEVKVQLLAP
ncbi:PIN domain-containing protein [Pseudonocardia sp.]|uniref:PIN domain-containing protein n=1 Tax=Pseudonocardia sp. TaxID=60912 RepID=UPI0026140AAE|nr:PIN domain-containing protein [Pseudonocardia sp.]MCW2719032.1 type toxin-antitoxin system VapC family toxin [Pseudonocardia sp.]